MLGMLLALAAAAWAVLVWQHADATMDMTAPVTWVRVAAVLVMWVVMMVAMMLPTAAPMILTFHRVQAANRQPRDAFVSTWVFVAAYLLVWAFAGIAAYVGMQAAEAAIVRAALSPAAAAQVGGAIIVVAGIYQLTPLKDVCLSKCREPIDFIVTSWRDGATSALANGLAPRSLLSGLLLASLCHPLSARHHECWSDGGCHSHYIRRENTALASLAPYATAGALVLYGALVITSPQLLPTFQQDGGAMPAEMQIKMPEREHPGRSSRSHLRRRKLQCPLLAQSGHRLVALHMSAFDTKRTSAGLQISL